MKYLKLKNKPSGLYNAKYVGFAPILVFSTHNSISDCLKVY